MDLFNDREKADILLNYVDEADVVVVSDLKLTSEDSQNINKEVVDLINLMKLNYEKQKQEYELKIDCLIQFYEQKIGTLEATLKQTEAERNELADLVSEVVGQNATACI